MVHSFLYDDILISECMCIFIADDTMDIYNIYVQYISSHTLLPYILLIIVAVKVEPLAYAEIPLSLSLAALSTENINEDLIAGVF